MSVFYNRTRRSHSIALRLLREGRIHLLPIYYLVRTSELGREGIDHSGSYRFADHIYQGKAAGRFGIGRVLDVMLLRLKSARAMRARYVAAKRDLRGFIDERAACDASLTVLAVPCGLARELFEIANELDAQPSAATDRVRIVGMDLDEHLVRRLARIGNPLRMMFRVGDALQPEAYTSSYDLVLSTGLTEFLTDDQTVAFYRVVFTRLNPGGRFVTSGMGRHALSDYLLRHLAEVDTHYRSAVDLQRLARAAGFRDLTTYQAGNDLQTILIGERT